VAGRAAWAERDIASANGAPQSEEGEMHISASLAKVMSGQLCEIIQPESSTFRPRTHVKTFARLARSKLDLE
jgi:hypothetical protein